MPKKLFISIWGIRAQDKKDESKKGRSVHGVSKIPISRTPNGVVGANFAEGGGRGSFSPLTRYVFHIAGDYFYRVAKANGGTFGKRGAISVGELD